MIFYFSATGNSQYTAEKLADQTNDKLVSIGVALRDGHFSFDLTGNTYLGFVIPTFAWTLPGAVAKFIEKLELVNAADLYVYGIFTCGESSGHTSAALSTMLGAKSIPFHGSFDLVMPDNFILWSDLPPEHELNSILSSADKALDAIILSVKARSPGYIDNNPPKELYMKTSLISTSGGSSNLHVTDACTACGTCYALCPMRCIQKDGSGRPVWEGECTMCLACLHRCPHEAIEHGKDTQGKIRYKNPFVRPVFENLY
ncbi:MAG: hypothetical protein GX111_10975 [Clostridiales bacterium]|nr:hypothetical protein [Clostridiales bacterium]